MVMTLTAFTACSSDDDNDNTCYFTFGVSGMSVSGSTEDFTTVSDYMQQVSNAYYKALGMSSSQNYTTVTGDYKTLKDQMKTKFESVELPAKPTIDCEYSFTMTLYGADLSKSHSDLDLEDMDVVASKTFSK